MALGQRPSEAPEVLGSDNPFSGAGGVSTFLLRPTGPDNSIGSYNFPWCVCDPGDIGSTGFGFALWTPLPFCSAI